MTKIFCIGFQKTGTSSLNKALRFLGYRLCSTEDRQRLWKRVVIGDFENLIDEVIEKYDAFEDNPFFWPNISKNKVPMYEYLYLRYPDSQFILTKRKNRQVWLKSFIYQNNIKENPIAHNYIYGEENLSKSDFEGCADIYEEYNKNAIDFFSDKPKGRFMVFSCDSGDGWEKLCNFLNKLVPIGIKFPHSNKAKGDGFKKTVKRILKIIGLEVYWLNDRELVFRIQKSSK
jgi:hypothetical protein